MTTAIQFETPENIQLAYQPAGLGTRFLAWFLDIIVLALVMIVMAFVLLCSGLATQAVFEQLGDALQEMGSPNGNFQPGRVPVVIWYFLGVGLLILGLGSFLYYGGSEFLMQGQTLGKRLVHIRVVNTDGFALDAPSILIRNIFRVVDHLPPLWIVPVVASKSQRFGDMVAGTVVISETRGEISPVRRMLLEQSPAERRFRFNAATLRRLRRQDQEAIEKLLERWEALAEEQRNSLLAQIVPPLVERLQVEPPAEKHRQEFLEDLLAAEYRRQLRRLG